MYQTTPDQSVEINFSLGSQVIKTHEKVNFIYRFYDAGYDLPLRKMQYDISIVHNGNQVFEENDAVSGAGVEWIYGEPGTTIIKIQNIKPYETVAETEISFTGESSGRWADFSTIVYENTEKTFFTEEIVQPRQTLQFYYEIAVAMIVVPVAMLLIVIWYMWRPKKSKISVDPEKKTKSNLNAMELKTELKTELKIIQRVIIVAIISGTIELGALFFTESTNDVILDTKIAVSGFGEITLFNPEKVNLFSTNIYQDTQLEFQISKPNNNGAIHSVSDDMDTLEMSSLRSKGYLSVIYLEKKT